MRELFTSRAGEVIDRRIEFVYLFDVKNGNPNGDPDGDNAPRIDPETGHGLVTDVCLKRKVRNFVGMTKEMKAPFDIYVKERGILAKEQQRAYLALEQTEGSDKPNKQARAWMCKNFYDVRSFGAVMTVGKADLSKDADGEADDKGAKAKENSKNKSKPRQWNCGQVRGPLQFAFSRSIDPILTLTHTITRVALTNPGDTDRTAVITEDGGEEAATGQMGRKHGIPYGLYRTHIFCSPFLAKDTGFTFGDLGVFVEAMVNLFELDRSASRGEMSSRALYAFEHSSELGNAPAHKLFDRIEVRKKTPITRDFSDYDVTAPEDGSEVTNGVKCWSLL